MIVRGCGVIMIGGCVGMRISVGVKGVECFVVNGVRGIELLRRLNWNARDSDGK